MQVLNMEQGSPEWKNARLGKVTGTRLKDVMGTPTARDNLLNELIAEQLTEQYEDIRVNDAMQRGTDEEPFAIKAYEKKFKCKTESVGFCISDEFDWLALSPDALRKKGKKYIAGAEVKSPMSKTVVKYLRKGGVPKEYHWQVVNYFLVCDELQELDFIIYDPRFKFEKLQLTVINVTRADLEEDLNSASESLQKFKEVWDEELANLTF